MTRPTKGGNVKFDLTLGERFQLTKILPPHDNITTMRDVLALFDVLMPTEEEHKEFGVVQTTDGTVKWNPDMADVEVGVELTNPQVAVIVNSLNKLQEQKKIKKEHVSLWDKFMEE